MKLLFKRTINIILIIAVLFTFFTIDVSASEVDTLISIAKAEVGTQEDGNDNVKYNNYNGQQWCGWFVSWCAKQAGLSKIIPQFASCSDGYNNKLPDAGGIKHKSKTRGGTYTPQKGDIIFFWKVSDSDPNGIHHVGIVYKVDSTYVYYYDGNNTGKTPHCVASSKRTLDSYQIYGYITPDYSSSNNITYAKGDDQSHVTIKWAKVTNATKYTLQRRKAGDSSYSDVKTGITSTSYTDSGLATGQRYYYKVVAYNGSTKLSTSDSVGVYTKFNPPAVTTVSNSKLKISWNGVSKAESYTIMRRKDGEEYDDIKTVTATEYTDSGLSPNTRYYYWIQANCNVDGDEMVAKSTTGQSYTLTDAPSISSKSDVTNTSLTLSWNSVSGANSYKVQYRQAGDQWDTGSAWVETTNTSCNIANLGAGKLYWFRVYAVGNGGNSAPSDSKGIYLNPNAPTAVATGVNSINVNWAYPGGETKFELLTRKSGAADYSTLATDIDGTSYTHNGLIPGTQYYYKIKAYNKENSSIVSGRSDAGYAYTKLLAPTVTAKDANSISLSWDRGVMDGDYTYAYRICRRLSGTSDFAGIAIVSEKSYRDTGLQPNTSYDYYIDVLRNDGVWCTNSEGITVTTSIQDVTGISVTPDSLTLRQGETYMLSANVYPDNANNKTVTWSSEDSNVAIVDSNGTVTAVNVGNTKIHAVTANGHESVCNVTVQSNYPTVDLGDDFNAYINYEVNGKYVTREENSDVQLRSYSGKSDQKWHFVKQSDGSYKILSLAQDDYNVLDVSGWGDTSGTNVGTYYDNDYIDGNSSSNQRWYIIQSANGYRLKPQCSECMLDVEGGGDAADGTQIRMWEYLDYGAQEFYINKINSNDILMGKVVEYNGHFYQGCYVPGLTWNGSNTYAQKLGGHLATISDEQENEFILNNIKLEGKEFFIGFNDIWDEGNFTWSNGESVTYTNWSDGEPNNAGNNEDAVHIRPNGEWNDADANTAYDALGFIVEYEPQIESEFEYNGHKYIIYSITPTWDIAEEYCEKLGGHLVTINDAEENAEITSHLNDGSYYIGASSIDESGANWEWVTGEPFEYSNWDDGEPNNTGTNESVVEIYSPGKWNDVTNNSYENGRGFVCEVPNTAITNFAVDVIGSYALVSISAVDVPESATIYLASYNSDKLLSLDQLTLNDGSTQAIIPVTNISKIKVFIWDAETIKPLCSFREWSK